MFVGLITTIGESAVGLRLKGLLLPPTNEVGKGNVFTHVCYSVRGGSTKSVCRGGTPPPGPEGETLPPFEINYLIFRSKRK